MKKCEVEARVMDINTGERKDNTEMISPEGVTWCSMRKR